MSIGMIALATLAALAAFVAVLVISLERAAKRYWLEDAKRNPLLESEVTAQIKQMEMRQRFDDESC